MNDESSPLMTADEVAAYLNISKRTIKRMRNDGEFVEPMMFGASARWRRSELISWLNSRQAPQQDK